MSEYNHCNHCMGDDPDGFFGGECPEEQQDKYHSSPCPEVGMCDGKFEVAE